MGVMAISARWHGVCWRFDNEIDDDSDTRGTLRIPGVGRRWAFAAYPTRPPEPVDSRAWPELADRAVGICFEELSRRNIFPSRK